MKFQLKINNNEIRERDITIFEYNYYFSATIKEVLLLIMFEESLGEHTATQSVCLCEVLAW